MTHRGLRCFAALVVLLVVASLTTVATTVGGAGAHTPHDTIGAIVTSPDFSEDQTVYLKAELRLLKSIDGGETWATLQNGTPAAARDIAVSAADTDALYMTAEEGIFRSTNGGDAWSRVSGEYAEDPWKVVASALDPDKAIVINLVFGGVRATADGGATWTEATASGTSSIAASRTEAELAVIGLGSGGVQTSADFGATWSGAVPVLPGPVRAVGVAGADASLVYAGGEGGALLRSEDGGSSFSPVGSGLPDEEITSVSATFDGQTERIWVSTDTTGVYYSEDAGQTWSERSEGLTTDIQADAVDRPQFNQLAIGPRDGAEPVLFLSGFDGLFTSNDGGEMWEQTQVLADHITGLAVSPNFAEDQQVAVASYVKGAFISQSAGDEWQFSTNGLTIEELTAGNELLPVLRLHNIFYSPDFANDNTMFSASWTNVLRSVDGGQNWERSFVSEPPADTVLRLFILEPSPNYAEDTTLYVGSRQGEIFRSTEGGATKSFELLSTVDGRVRDLAISASFAADKTLFVSTDMGILRSTDAGSTWDEVLTGNNSLVSMSPEFADDGVIFAGTEAGLMVSNDRGDTWTAVDDSAVGSGRIEGVTVSPAFGDDGLVLASVRGSGLYRSTDGGTTFAAIAPELFEQNLLIADFFTNPSATPIHFSPDFANDQTVFAFGEASVLRSRDAGESWTILELPSWKEFPLPVGFQPEDGPVITAPPTSAASESPASVNAESSGVATGLIVGLGLGALVLAAGGAWLLASRRRAAAEAEPTQEPERTSEGV